MRSNKELIKHLSSLVTEQRLEKIESVLNNRMDYMTVALENIYQPHNASAVLRTCDCFGVQNVHIIENDNEYNINPDVALGSTKWIDMHKYSEKKNNTLDAINHLKNEGYRIVATTPHTDDVDLDDFDVTKGKFALIFGTELTGISDIVRDNADEYLKIPMYGFTESFNISVSAAIIMNHLNHKIRISDADWKLTPERKEMLKLQWLKNSVKRVEIIEKEFNKRK